MTSHKDDSCIHRATVADCSRSRSRRFLSAAEPRLPPLQPPLTPSLGQCAYLARVRADGSSQASPPNDTELAMRLRLVAAAVAPMAEGAGAGAAAAPGTRPPPTSAGAAGRVVAAMPASVCATFAATLTSAFPGSYARNAACASSISSASSLPSRSRSKAFRISKSALFRITPRGKWPRCKTEAK